MFYEIVLTMQLVHLNCRKAPVQPPTRKEGWDLFRITSDANSRFTPINMNIKLPRSETPWQKKELRRVVDPPWRIKTTMGKRDNSRWRKEWWDFQTKVRGLRHTLVVWHHWCKPFQLWKKLWSKSNSWSWGMISRLEGKFVVYSIWIYKNKYTEKGLWFVSK